MSMERLQETSSRFVSIDGCRLHYHDVGSGPLLLCIHGGAPGATGWINFGRNVPELSKHFRTVVIDLPGYGKSDKPDIQSGRHEFYARMMVGLIHSLGESRAHVLGMATGGSVAMLMAINHPEVVDRLVLVSSAGSRSMFGMKPLRPASYEYLSGDGPSPEKMRVYLEQLIYDKELITEEVIQERYLASIDPEFLKNAPEGRTTRKQTPTDLWKKVDQIKCETLIIWGRENRTHSFESALFLHSLIENSQVHIFGKCGLWVPYEKLNEFNRLVVSFLEG